MSWQTVSAAVASAANTLPTEKGRDFFLQLAKDLEAIDVLVEAGKAIVWDAGCSAGVAEGLRGTSLGLALKLNPYRSAK